jgi:hypothetical protein
MSNPNPEVTASTTVQRLQQQRDPKAPYFFNQPLLHFFYQRLYNTTAGHWPYRVLFYSAYDLMDGSLQRQAK